MTRLFKSCQHLGSFAQFARPLRRLAVCAKPCSIYRNLVAGQLTTPIFSNELTISHATDIQAIEFKRFNLFSETVFELPLIASTWVAV